MLAVAVAIIGLVTVFTISIGKTKKFDRPIPEPLVAESDNNPVNLGELSSKKVAVSIPGGTFKTKTNVTVVSPEEVVNIAKDHGKIVAVPFEISIGSGPTRLQHLVTITTIFDKSKLAKNSESASLRAAFFDGDSWRFIRPEKVDMEAGTLTFTTDHFTQFAAVQIPIEETIKQHAHSATLGQMAQEKMDEVMDEIMDKAVDGLLEKGLKMNSKQYKTKILASLLKKREYGDMVKALQDKDFGEYTQKMNALVGETLLEQLPKSELIDGLKKLGGLGDDDGIMESVGETAKVAGQAMGALAEGDMRGAAKYIGEAIADKFVVVQAAKAAVEVMQYEIDAWRDDKVEAAYEAYKNGKESNSYLGYNVDKGDFEAVWQQMRAIGERLEYEAVEKEEEIRRDGNAPPLSDREIEIIKGKVKINLKAMFESRAKKDAEVAKRDERNEELLKAYEKANLFDEGVFRYSREKYDIDTRIDSLLSIRETILNDLENNPKGKKPTDGDIVALTQAMLSGTMAEGKKLYAERLKRDFGVDLGGTAGGGWILKEISSYTSNVPEHVIYENPAVISGAKGGEIPNSLASSETYYKENRQITHSWTVPTKIDPGVPFAVEAATLWHNTNKMPEVATMRSTRIWLASHPYLETSRSKPQLLDPGLRKWEYGDSHVGPAKGSYSETWKEGKDGDECKNCFLVEVHNEQNSMTAFQYTFVYKK